MTRKGLKDKDIKRVVLPDVSGDDNIINTQCARPLTLNGAFSAQMYLWVEDDGTEEGERRIEFHLPDADGPRQKKQVGNVVTFELPQKAKDRRRQFFSIMDVADNIKQNSLKAAFGLEPITPNEQFYRNPCAETISNIPKSFQTEEMVLLALNGETTQEPVLKNVAKRLLTQQICEEAVSRAVTNFIYVPDAYKTEKMCLDVIDVPHEKYRDFSPYLLIRYVPEKYLSGPNGKEFFKRAVRANNSALVYVPTEYITGELFEDSTDSMGSAETKEHIRLLKTAATQNLSILFFPKTRQ